MSAAPAVHRPCAQAAVPHELSPHTEATSLTHTAPQVLLQHEGLTAQISVTHGSHVASSLTPVVQSS